MQNLNSLQANAKKLQADTEGIKVISFGSKNGTKNFIDEVHKSIEFGFQVKNETDKSIYIAIVAGLGVFNSGNHVQEFNPASFMAASDLLTRSGADCVLSDGTIYEKEIGDSGVYNAVTAITKNSKRKIAEVTKFAAKSPFRFTRFVMSSYKNDGTPESSNYNNRIKSLWVSPFEDTVEQEFSLRSIVRDKFQAHLLELDFQKDAPNLQAIMSDEHIMVIQVNAGTTLNINSYVGAQLSQAQYFYRAASAADNIMRPVRLGM